MFTDHKISAFQQRVSDLPDTPTLSASELKARFDACPEELRAALNAVCDDGKALEDRMDAYQAQTFTGEVERDMLAPDVQEELSAKAEQEDLSQLSDRTDALEAKTNTLTLALANQVAVGTYKGTDSSSNPGVTSTREIELGFRPKAVLVMGRGCWIHPSEYTYFGGLAVTGQPAQYGSFTMIELTETGFRVYNGNEGSTNYRLNYTGITYSYVALQ